MEPLNHFKSHVSILNEFYEWPRTRSEYNIFFREVFKMEKFWPELLKKYKYINNQNLYRTFFGLVTAAGDTAPKLAAW